MSRNTDNFDMICGNCEGVDLVLVTEDDVRTQAVIWAQPGEERSTDMLLLIESAIDGLREYQRQAVIDWEESETCDGGKFWFRQQKYIDGNKKLGPEITPNIKPTGF